MTAENRYNNLIPSLSTAITRLNGILPIPKLNEHNFSTGWMNSLTKDESAKYEGEVEAMSYLKSDTYEKDFYYRNLPLLTVFMGGGSFQICE